MSLLDVAKKTVIRTREGVPVTDEEIELAVAWMKGDIRMKQVQAAISCRAHGSVYQWIPLRLKAAYDRGIIKVVSKSNPKCRKVKP